VKQLIFLLAIVLCGVSSSRAQGSLQEAVLAFDEGTVHLLEGDFSAALALYTEAEKLGWASPELFYNMGLANRRMNRLGPAVQYLEKAKRLSPDDAKILHSLGVAAHQQVDRFSVLPTPLLQKLHRGSLRILPILPAFWLGYLLGLAFVCLLVGKLLFGLRGEWWRQSRIVLGVGAFLFLAYALGSSAWPPNDTTAVILASEVQLRSQADESSEEVLRIHEGLVVKVENETMDWAWIEVSNGTKGWVSRTVLGSI